MLFTPQIARKPDLYPWTSEFMNRMWAGFWTPNEFSFSADYSQFHAELTEQEQRVITRTLSAIGQIEIAVKKFWANLGDNLQHPSLQDLGYVMAQSEVIHNRAYEKLLSRLGMEEIFSENLKEDVVRNRVNYLRKYTHRVYDNDRKQYVYAIILFTLFVENVSLFSQFYTIMHFNRNKNVLKDTAQQVSYTKNEETLHAQVGIKIINTLREEYPDLFDKDLEQRILEESSIALDAECGLIDWMIGDYSTPGLDARILKAFLAKRMNDSLAAIGFPVVFDIPSNLETQTRWFEEELFGNNRKDFFHSKPTDYAKKTQSFNTEDLF